MSYLTDIYTTPSGARLYPPSYELKHKAGEGGISQQALRRAQAAIETPDIDYKRYGARYVRDFGHGIRKAAQGQLNLDTQRGTLLNPVMMLKATGAMFHYGRLSEIAESAMLFIEQLDHIEDDALQVLRAYHDALKVMVDKALAGDGGSVGRALADELEQALRRYYNKHANNQSNTSQSTDT